MTRLHALAPFLAALGTLTLLLAASPATSTPAPLKVGTYDNRAIAIAFAHSKFHKDFLKQVRAEMEEARAAKNKARVEEIKKQMEWRQTEFHLKGFGHFPVQDLLEPIKAKLPDLAKKAGVDLVAWEVDYHGDQVEVVDVTDLLVQCYAPGKRALGHIASLKKHAPVDLQKLLHHKCGKH